MNLVLHACVTALVFFLTLELWKDLRVAGIAGFLFALHPVHTEPVVWIAAVPDLAYTLCFLLALYFWVVEYKPAHHAHDAHHAHHALIACTVCYAVGLLWKESAIMFLPAVILYDALVLRQFRFRRYVGLGAVTLVYLMVRIAVFGGIAPGVVHEGMSRSTEVLTAISHLGTYLEKLLVPVNLTIFYPLRVANAIDVRIIAVLLVFGVAAWKLRGKMVWSLFWIPLVLLPALSVSHVVVPLSERNLYLASVGFVWLSAATVSHLDRVRGLVLVGALSIAYFAVDWIRVPAWRDELSLFGQALRQDPANQAIRLRLSTELARRGRVDEAMVQLDVILKRDPNHVNALTSKAGLLVMKEDWPGVKSACSRAFALDPDSALCHLDVGIAELRQGRPQEAWIRFDRAYERNPRMWQALLQQGILAMEAGDFATAVPKLERVLSLRPTAPVFTILGEAYIQMGNPRKAVNALQEALRINPSFAPAQQALDPLVRNTGH